MLTYRLTGKHQNNNIIKTIIITWKKTKNKKKTTLK